MFGGGGGGLDSRKMQQMMEQMGIDIDELEAEEVVIRTGDEELVFTDADVQRMDAQGQEIYNITGNPDTREQDTDAATDDDTGGEGGDGVPQEDIETVVEATGASEKAAREALEATNGMPVEAIRRLE